MKTMRAVSMPLRGAVERLFPSLVRSLARAAPAREPVGLGPVMVEFPPGVRLHLLFDLAREAGCVLEVGDGSRTLRLVPAEEGGRHSTAPDLAPEGI